MHEKVIILDFGSQYTQLIARRVRELDVFCEIYPFPHAITIGPDVKGVILSGSPFSVLEEGSPRPAYDYRNSPVPVLGICYGAQLMAHENGGKVQRSTHREYGRAHLENIGEHPLFENIEPGTQVWMSHGDSITGLGDDYRILAGTASIPVGAYAHNQKAIYGLQFHPEVYHTIQGKDILANFVKGICGCSGDWSPRSFVEETVADLAARVPADDQVVMALSGGVDSTVAAVLLHKAIGSRLHCVFVDNGLLRKDEFATVLDNYHSLGLNIRGVDATGLFMERLAGVSDPEQKRKIIGKTFIDVFDTEARSIPNVRWLGQGTIYPDVIESVSVHGPSVTIKSHHNVGGLPEKMNMKVVEPLRMLFKDEVRRVGAELGLDPKFLERHPFPGPGLAIRILGDITPEKVGILQEADAIYIEGLKSANLYHQVWQAGAILLPVQSVGVMGDERTYENAVCLRAVTSTDGMTADWAHLPYEFLARISNDIINRVKGINRVVYDISSKPPATIEWE